jgi:hypothetical protein
MIMVKSVVRINLILLEHGVKLTSTRDWRITEDVVAVVRAIGAGRGDNLVILGARVVVLWRGFESLIPNLTRQHTSIVVLFLLDVLLDLGASCNRPLLPLGDWLGHTGGPASSFLPGLGDFFGLLKQNRPH